VLTDGTYELIPESEGGDLEAQVNTIVLTEATDQSSEEPRAEIVSDYQEDTSVLTDGTYELIPESEGGDLEAQVNTTVLTEAPDQSSEEPRAEIVSDYREGKPRT